MRRLEALGRKAASVVARVKPTVSPLVERAVAQIALVSVSVDVVQLRGALEELLKRSVQTVDVPVKPVVQPPPVAGVLHLTRLVEQRIAQIQRLFDFAECRDPVEAVHQLRVASRRLRAFVDMFAPFVEPKLARRARRQLRKITRAVRDLRDSDVQTEDLERRLVAATTERERIAVNHLLDHARRTRQRLAGKAQKKLSRIDQGELASRLRAALDQVALRVQSPAASYELIAELAYEPILAQAREAFPDWGSTPSAEALHRFRLALKRLRYASELIEPALGEGFAEVYEPVKRLQTTLGQHQDSVEFERLLLDRRARAVRHGRATLAQGLEVILEQAKRERAAHRERCAAECAELSAVRWFRGRADRAALPA